MLALALVLGLMPSALAYEGTGNTLYTESVTIGPGTVYTNESAWHNGNGKETSYYIEYKPSTSVKPVAVYGNKLYGTSNIVTATKFLTDKGYYVLGGINADFFSLQTGLPLGMVVIDGVLRSSDAGNNAIGFYPNGSAVIGKPGLTLQASYTPPAIDTSIPAELQPEATTAKTFAVDHVNKLRTAAGGVYLLTPDFSTTSRTSTDGVNVLIYVTSGSLRISGTVTGKIASVTQSADAVAIPDGTMLLTCAADGPADRLSGLAVGGEISITVTPANANWIGVEHAVGGGDLLLQNGEIMTDLDTSISNAITPRSAVGIKADGTVVLFAVDGRQASHSKGLSLYDVAAFLKEKGCVTALNLDGGGSTSFAVRNPGTDGSVVVNKPSDGSNRKVANFIMLVNNAPTTGNYARLHLLPYKAVVMTGASVDFTVNATDTNYYAMPVNVPVTLTAESSAGTVSGQTFTAGDKPYEGVISAAMGAVTGTAELVVTDKIDDLVFTIAGKSSSVTSLNLDPGEKVSLVATGYLNMRPVYSSNRSFTWEIVDGNIGSVDEDGVFTAASGVGLTGSIKVSYNGFEKTLPVTIGKSPILIDSFESGVGSLVSYQADDGSARFAATAATAKDQVKYGSSAAGLSYQFGTQAALRMSANYMLSSNPTKLNFWLYGDGSGNQFGVSVEDSSGNVTDIPVTALSFTGYQAFSVDLPSKTAKIAGFTLMQTEGAAKSGQLYLDQLVGSFGEFQDTSAPSIVFADPAVGETAVLTARITDGGTGISTSNITLTHDGTKQTFTYNAATGDLSFQLPAETGGGLHRVTITATDFSGNISRASYEYTTAGDDPGNIFVDMAGHWAAPYVNYAAANKILNGQVIDELTYYNPDNNMTRAEFAVALSNFLKVDKSAYSATELPFLDTGDIPAWALGAAKAMYAKGLIGGKQYNDDIIFDPYASITRAEIMTILSRTLPAGYAAPELSFADAAEIPGYALEATKILCNLGVVGGYEDGTVKPGNPVKRSEVAKMLFGMN